jgi:hypothetical protein
LVPSQANVLLLKAFVGHDSLVPSHTSATSQSLTAFLQSVPAGAALTGQVVPPVHISARSQALPELALQTVPGESLASLGH